MDTQSTITLAVGAVIVAFLTLTPLARVFTSGRSAPSPDQTRYLMDELMTERNTGKVLRVELDAVKIEVTYLRSENAALKLQVADLWQIVRGQSVAASSANAAAATAKPGARTQHATVHMTDADVSFRDWLIAHFDAEELDILTADCGIEKLAPGTITSKATALVQLARRIGMLERVEQAAMDSRPSVASW